MLHVSDDGTCTEIASVGNEGLVGVSLLLGGETTSSQAVVQIKGQVCRLSSLIFRQEFDRSREIQQLVLGYTQLFLTLISQTAVCNQRHSAEQQLCRWLLLGLDRLNSQELSMTHERLSNTLGVRREAITRAALRLHQAGLISYRRGRMKVIDHTGLEACCCECYGVMRRAFNSLQPADSDEVYGARPLSHRSKDAHSRRSRAQN